MIDKTLAEEFYIIQTRPQWYQLRLTYNKECIATAISLDAILENLRNIAERYEDGDAIRRAWVNAEFKKTSEATQAFNEKQYTLHKDDFRSSIEDVISKERKVNIKKFVTAPKKKVKVMTPKIKLPDIEEEVVDVTPIIKPKLKKKLMPKKKK